MRVFVALSLIITLTRVNASVEPAPIKRVLVLGSGGLIGSHLKTWLLNHGYEVEEVINREHIDLRVPGALDIFPRSDRPIDALMFIAAEVGGSRYLSSEESQRAIIESNVKIYQTVFEWLKRHPMPFIFTSSYLQSQSTSYGSVKRLGEAWIKALGFGRTARLWNAYGPERLGQRSHVISDWISGCLIHRHVKSLTDGHEYRQMTHVVDIARGLGIMLEHYHLLEPVTDLSNGHWMTLREIGTAIALVTSDGASNAGATRCHIKYSNVQAQTREQVEPNLNAPFHQHWAPIISFHDGLMNMREYYHERLTELKRTKLEL